MTLVGKEFKIPMKFFIQCGTVLSDELAYLNID